MKPLSIDSTYDGARWGSHLPALAACVAATYGPVLEIGAGYFSTFALHAMCKTLSRPLVTVEPSREWLTKFATLLEGPNHQFRQSISDALWAVPYHVVFMDWEGEGDGRVGPLMRCAQYCTGYLLLHDYEGANVEAMSPHIEGFRFKRISCPTFPPTLILSRFKPIPEIP